MSAIYKLKGAAALGQAGNPIVTALLPLAVSSTVIAAAKAASSSTNAYTILANPDTPRIARLVASASGWDGGDITITGTDPFDRAQTETLTPNNSTVAKDGTKLWKTITAASKATVGASGTTVSLGVGATIGPFIDREENIWIDVTNGPFVVQPPVLADLSTSRRLGLGKSDSGFNALTTTPSNSETLGAAAAATDILAGQGEFRAYRKASTTNFAIEAIVTGLPA